MIALKTEPTTSREIDAYYRHVRRELDRLLATMAPKPRRRLFLDHDPEPATKHALPLGWTDFKSVHITRNSTMAESLSWGAKRAFYEGILLHEVGHLIWTTSTDSAEWRMAWYKRYPHFGVSFWVGFEDGLEDARINWRVMEQWPGTPARSLRLLYSQMWEGVPDWDAHWDDSAWAHVWVISQALFEIAVFNRLKYPVLPNVRVQAVIEECLPFVQKLRNAPTTAAKNLILDADIMPRLLPWLDAAKQEIEDTMEEMAERTVPLYGGMPEDVESCDGSAGDGIESKRPSTSSAPPVSKRVSRTMTATDADETESSATSDETSTAESHAAAESDAGSDDESDIPSSGAKSDASATDASGDDSIMDASAESGTIADPDSESTGAGSAESTSDPSHEDTAADGKSVRGDATDEESSGDEAGTDKATDSTAAADDAKDADPTALNEDTTADGRSVHGDAADAESTGDEARADGSADSTGSEGDAENAEPETLDDDTAAAGKSGDGDAEDDGAPLDDADTEDDLAEPSHDESTPTEDTPMGESKPGGSDTEGSDDPEDSGPADNASLDSDSKTGNDLTPREEPMPDLNWDPMGDAEPFDEPELDEAAGELVLTDDEFDAIQNTLDELVGDWIAAGEAEAARDAEIELRHRKTDAAVSAWKPEGVHHRVSVRIIVPEVRPDWAAQRREEAAPMVRAFLRELKRLEAEHDTGWETSQRRGQVDPRAVWKRSMGRVDYFRRRLVPDDQKDLAVLALLDASGSIQGDPRRYKAQILAGIMLATVLRTQAVPHSVVSFNTYGPEVQHHVLIGFDKWQDPAAVDRVASYVASGENRDGYSLRWATDYLARQEASRSLLIVVSDGVPSHGGYGNSSGLQDTALAVQEAEKRGVTVLGVSIGNDHHYVPDLYPRRICLDNPLGLPKALGKTILQLIS